MPVFEIDDIYTFRDCCFCAITWPKPSKGPRLV